MSNLLADVTPLNLLEEKHKFFADENRTYNPQFIYTRQIAASELTAWGFPSSHNAAYAEEMLKNYHKKPPLETEYIIQADVEKVVTEFNEYYRIQPPIQATFSENNVARCKISGNYMVFQLPLRYSLETLADLCRHELETHVLRRMNHQRTQWPTELVIEDKDFRATEEGIAGLHTHLLRKDKMIWKTYLMYVAVYAAQQQSFVEVFHKMKGYGLSDLRAWSTTLRTKRGLTDTALAGGLTKDISYLHGVVSVWDWLINQKKDPHMLYIGRLGLQQIEQNAQYVDMSELVYPRFFEPVDEYLTNIAAIGEINQFHHLI